MLQTLRDGTKSNLMRAFLMVLVVGFGMWGIGDIFRSSPSDEDAITVGDVTISAQEVAVYFDQTRRYYYPSLNNNEAISIGLMDQIMTEMAERALFDAEAARLGITVTREMAKDAIRRNPMFLDETGQFNALLFRDILASRGMTENDLVASIGYAERRNQIIAAIASGAEYSPDLSKNMAQWLAQKRTITYVELLINPDHIDDPSNDTLSAWYAENTSTFDAPATRQIVAAILSPDDFINEINISDEEIESIYEERKDSLSIPERRNFYQMVFSDTDQANTALARLNAGEDFAIIANDMLGDSEEDITFTNIARDDLPEDLADIVFAASQNQVTTPAETPFGIYVFLINDISPAEIPLFSDIKSSLADEIRNEQAINTVYDRIQLFETAQESGATLEEAAAEAGARLLSIPALTKTGRDIDGEWLDGIASSTAFRSIAWQQDIGMASMLITDENNTFFALRVESETDKRSRTLDEVRNTAITAWKMEQAIADTRAKAETIVAAPDYQKAVADLDLDLMNSPEFLQNGSGLDHEAASLIASASFAINIGDRTLVEPGDDKMIVLKMESIIDGDEESIALRTEQLLNEFSDHMAADSEAAIAYGLQSIHSVNANPNAAIRLLVGSTN
ncbi:MAG: SurA N-terminal domain-containing protein [Candidatus Puniceispirillales bacterium]